MPTGTGTRPTSDRAREALFSTLTSMVGAWVGRRVLDLYAGSGAVGLEAVSRGADHCLLVESDPRALRTLRANLETVGLQGAEAHGGRVERLVSGGPPGGSQAYDVVFLDPPYDLPAADVTVLLGALADPRWSKANGWIVVERPSRDRDFAWPTTIGADREKNYGETVLWYGRPHA